MKLILMMKGEEKIFTTPFVTARHYRKLLEYDQEIDYADMELENVDELAGFVRNVFGDQFTVDELYDGLPSHKLISTFIDVFTYVRSGEVPRPKKDTEEGNGEGK